VVVDYGFEIIPMFPELRQQGLGVVAPFDFALDRELWRWTPPEVSLHVTRLPSFAPVMTLRMAESLADIQATRRATADLLVPGPLAVGFACASGSFVEGIAGEQRLVEAMLDAGAPAAMTTSGAFARALRHVDARKVAVATPYLDEVTVRLLDFLAEHGMSIVRSSGLGRSSQIWSLSYMDVFALALEADHPDADALVVSCTNVRSYDIIAPLEKRLGKPVLTANQVTMWDLLTLAGFRAEPNEQALFTSPPELMSTRPCPDGSGAHWEP
jgi:maleate isomerase